MKSIQEFMSLFNELGIIGLSKPGDLLRLIDNYPTSNEVVHVLNVIADEVHKLNSNDPEVLEMLKQYFPDLTFELEMVDNAHTRDRDRTNMELLTLLEKLRDKYNARKQTSFFVLKCYFLDGGIGVISATKKKPSEGNTDSIIQATA